MRYLIAFLWIIVVSANLSAQSFINGNIESGYSGWSCTASVANESDLGGYQALNNVAHITKDDVLCQSLTGLTLGQQYIISFDAARCNDCNESQKFIRAVVQIDTSQIGLFSRNLPFYFINQSFVFTATNTNHVFSIKRDGRWGNNFCGLALDNFIITPCVTYPVELTSFRASNGRNDVILKWTTASETNNNHWEIMRAETNMNWFRIGTVEGLGTTKSITNYSFIDNEPIQGDSYYRLWQVDNDGTVTQSNVISVTRDLLEAKISVYPNPAVNYVTIEMNNLNQYTAAIFDHTGRLVNVIENIAKQNILNLDISNLSSGGYYLSLTGRIDPNQRASVPFTVAR
jgi:hypothetical protein